MGENRDDMNLFQQANSDTTIHVTIPEDANTGEKRPSSSSSADAEGGPQKKQRLIMSLLS